MSVSRLLRISGVTVTLAGALACVLSVAASAYPLRAPQVPLQTGWDGISLQTYFGSVGEGLNTLADQLDLQTWHQPASGSGSVSLRMEIAGYAGSNSIGVYNAGDVSPVLHQIFPGAATAGWYATCNFTAGGHLLVSLYDNGSVFQGSTNYSGVDADNFGFYLQGPAGTFYSQDYRNAGGKPQVLTFAGTGPYLERWWECFEDLPYASSDVDFQDTILLLESFVPTPVRSTTWGAIKSLYR
jgi:hypothetical protein